MICHHKESVFAVSACTCTPVTNRLGHHHADDHDDLDDEEEDDSCDHHDISSHRECIYSFTPVHQMVMMMGRLRKEIALTMMNIYTDQDGNDQPGGGDDRFTKFVSGGDGWWGW